MLENILDIATANILENVLYNAIEIIYKHLFSQILLLSFYNILQLKVFVNTIII